MTDEADLEHSYRLFGYQGNYVFKADLLPEHGKMKLLGGVIPSHHNVWFYEKTERAPLFLFDRELGK